jgi:hypothetical protein
LEHAKIIRTNVAELSKDERGFIRLKLLNTEADFDLTEAKQQFEAACFLSNNQPYKVLVDTREAFVSPDKEAERFITSVKLRYAEALIITSLHYRILAKFYVKGLPHSAKVFRDEEEAIDWIVSLAV